MEPWTQKPIDLFIKQGCFADYDTYGEDIRQATREMGVRNMLIKQRLLALLGKLEEKDVYPIVMKGCHLTQGLYPFGIRPMEDIDLLISRKDYAAADEAVRSLGYKDKAYGMDVWTHVEVSNKMTYTDGSYPLIPMDIHYTLGPYPYLGRIPFESLFEHSEIFSHEKITMRVLRPEMLLVHLCLHLFQHQDEHWEISAYDICTLTTLQQNRFDWSRFTSIVSTYSLKLPILHGIRKALGIAPVLIPHPILKEIESMEVPKNEQRIFKASLYMNKGMEKYFLQFLTLPGIRLKLQCLKRIIFPRPSFLRYYYEGSYLKYAMDACRVASCALRNSWK